MNLIRSFLTLLVLMVGINPTLAVGEDSLKLHYYYLRSTIIGQEPFAKALSEFRSAVGKNRKSNLSESSKANLKAAREIIQFVPKSKGSNEVLTDIQSIADGVSEAAGDVISKYQLYSTLAKYLMSGPMKAPRAYEAMGLSSEREMTRFRQDIVYFVTQSNSGKLSAEESESLSLLFQYYTGATLGLPVERILNDPLMAPFKEMDKLKIEVKNLVLNNIKQAATAEQKHQDALSLMATRLENIEKFKSTAQIIQNAKSFVELDDALIKVSKLDCVRGDTDLCENAKVGLIASAKARRKSIKSSELQLGIDAGLQLGLTVSQLTGNDGLGKTFQALSAANDAVKSVSAALDTYNDASTAMGSFASVAMATSAITGAVGAIAALAAETGQSADEQILAELLELKKMVVSLSEQVKAGFNDQAVRSDRIESLVESYGRLNSKSIAVIQRDMASLSENINNGIQPVKTIHLNFRNETFKQFSRLRNKGYELAFKLPDAKEPLSAANRESILDLFEELATISDAVKRGEYRLGSIGDDAVSDHFGLIKHLSAFPPSRFRTAFFIQNAVNSSQDVACADINLIGYIMISNAASELNRTLDKLSHFQLAGFFSNVIINKAELQKSIDAGHAFVIDQHKSIIRCIDKGFYAKFETIQLKRMLDLIRLQEDEFFRDGGRLNSILLTLQNSLPATTGFRKDKFRAGHLISSTRSFDPLNWEKIAPPAFIEPGYGLGDAGFRLSRKDFEAIVRSPEIRLAQNIGIDIDYRLESWWQVYTKDQFEKFNIVSQVVAYSSMARKVMSVWFENFPIAAAGKQHFEVKRWNVPNGQSFNYFNIIPNKLPEIYKNLSSKGLLFKERGKVGKVFYLGSDNLHCQNLHGFYECRDGYWRPVEGFQSQFNAEDFFNYPPYRIINDVYHQSTRPPFLYRNSINNGFRGKFEPMVTKYVDALRTVVKKNLSGCIEKLIQGEYQCLINGQKIVFPNRSKEFRIIENYNLIRASINPEYLKNGSLARLTDPAILSKIEVGTGVDSSILKVAKYRGMISDRIDQLSKRSNPEPKTASDDLSGILENRYHWLHTRLQPFFN